MSYKYLKSQGTDNIFTIVITKVCPRILQHIHQDKRMSCFASCKLHVQGWHNNQVEDIHNCKQYQHAAQIAPRIPDLLVLQKAVCVSHKNNAIGVHCPGKGPFDICPCLRIEPLISLSRGPPQCTTTQLICLSSTKTSIDFSTCPCSENCRLPCTKHRAQLERIELQEFRG